jgi:hypothetical protein
MGRRLNFEEPEIFKLRFGRYPKNRTIEDIHDIWLKLLERDKPRRKKHTDVWKEIEENDIKTIYVKQNGKIYEYKFQKDIFHPLKSTTYSRDVLEFKNIKDSKERDKKLEFILANDYQFELGKRFKETRNNLGKYHHVIKNIFIEKVSDELRKKFKDKTPDLINIVKVGEKKYYFMIKNPLSYYLEFEFGGEVKENVINL